jgi:predicted RNase H-like HicB family nuclease
MAECLNLPVVTQGHTLDETIAHLREAIEDG